MSTKTSEHLTVGDIYTRDQLRTLFSIKDATINNGVFRPKGHDSVWLFVTEDKDSDRTQYADYLEGDTLQWDGQLKGRTDHFIVNHRENDYVLLVFYRRNRHEFPNAGFKYEGEFEYVSHEGEQPSHFILRRK